MFSPWAKHTVQQDTKFNIWLFPYDFFSWLHCIMGQQLVHVLYMWVVYFHFRENWSQMRFCPCQSSHRDACLKYVQTFVVEIATYLLVSYTRRWCPCLLGWSERLDITGLSHCHNILTCVTWTSQDLLWKTGRQPPNLVWALTTNTPTFLCLAALQIKS